MSDFDFTITHVPEKANIVADSLSHHADLNPIRVAVVSISVESDLLADIRLTQEQNSSDTFSDLKHCAIAGDRGMYMHDRLICHTSCTGDYTIVGPDNKDLR